MSSMTTSQQAALGARGNVLVVAGAGTGKTHTLVERCCALLLEEGCSLDEILMVTFTDAAAAEMRKRIRARLTEKTSQITDARMAARLEEQIALLDTAYISTLHSFCLRLVREHFHDERLRLDPEFVVLTEEQVHQLRNNTLDTLLEAHYGGQSEEAQAFRAFVTEQVGGMEGKARDLIWKLHRYAQSLADPEAWFENELAIFSQAEPRQWREWWKLGFEERREQWVADLQPFSATLNVVDCLNALKALKAESSPREMAEALAKIRDARAAKWPRGTAGTVRDRLKEFFTDAAFLESLLPTADGKDPLAEDWEWSRGQMRTLLRLTREFGQAFDAAKRDAGGVDFADLEQFALRLLWDEKGKRPTPLAREWQARLKFVFVDEYQDINEAQDTILRALSREGADANRFLVGDVKQSIYRFRLADPKIFQAYKQRWEGRMENGRTIALSDNFRSREALLDFINSFFGLFMRSEIGGVAYDAEAELKFGALETRGHLSRETSAGPQVEIHLRTKEKNDNGGENGDAGEASEFAELDSTEKEARLVALQLKKLRREKSPVWDEDLEVFRPVEWRDMVVLMRSPRNKAEIYAREFSRAGVPLQVRRGSFYAATEVSDLLSLLQLLDNPMQDLPLLAVLRSPLVGLSVDELAMIRAGQREDRFWTAALRFAATRTRFEGGAGAIATGAQPKVRAFLKSFEKWRRQARRGALSHCVRTILDETAYESLVLAQERGEERLANVNRLLRLMRQFDPYQRQGLMRFLRFVEAQRDAEAEEEPASAAGEDAVRLLSIHQSKGLEFPVVAVADFGKRFNLGDLNEDILLDAEFGLCPKVVPPGMNGFYPSLPYWLARRRQKRELLGEELRLLYVAMTRARDRLMLVGSVTAKQFETRWREDGEINAASLLRAGSYADWLGAWFAKKCGAADGQTSGEMSDCRWFLRDDASLREGADDIEATREKAIVRLSRSEAGRLRNRLEAKYPFEAATVESAKTSVSTLRRRAMELMEQEETVELFRPRTRRKEKGAVMENSAAEIGMAHHRFLERVDFGKLSAVADLRGEAERMAGEGILSMDEIASLDFESLLRFWQSDFGRRILASALQVKRELAFTARFSPEELPHAARAGMAAELRGEFVIVQGVADLAVILPKEIWLLDYKTDRVAANEVKERGKFYEPQLNLYARALERIYGRPVTERRLHFLACGVTVLG